MLVLMVGAVAVKIGFTFDINQWGESRRKRLKEKLQAKCPHARFVRGEGGNFWIESSFSSPSGTLLHRCGMCGQVANDISVSEHIEYVLMRYVNNPEEYFKQHKAFRKARKKLYG